MSLACEEVFEEDTSTSEPISEKSITKTPRQHGNSPNSRFPKVFAHKVASNSTSNGTRLSPTMETHQEITEVR